MLIEFQGNGKRDTVREVYVGVSLEFFDLFIHTPSEGGDTAIGKEIPQVIFSYVPGQIPDVYSVVSLHNFGRKVGFLGSVGLE